MQISGLIGIPPFRPPLPLIPTVEEHLAQVSPTFDRAAADRARPEHKMSVKALCELARKGSGLAAKQFKGVFPPGIIKAVLLIDIYCGAHLSK